MNFEILGFKFILKRSSVGPNPANIMSESCLSSYQSEKSLITFNSFIYLSRF